MIDSEVLRTSVLAFLWSRAPDGWGTRQAPRFHLSLRRRWGCWQARWLSNIHVTVSQRLRTSTTKLHVFRTYNLSNKWDRKTNSPIFVRIRWRPLQSSTLSCHLDEYTTFLNTRHWVPGCSEYCIPINLSETHNISSSLGFLREMQTLCIFLLAISQRINPSPGRMTPVCQRQKPTLIRSSKLRFPNQPIKVHGGRKSFSHLVKQLILLRGIG